jgi:hypothetical protein
MNVDSIIGYIGGSCKGDSSEQDEWREAPVGSSIIKEEIKTHVNTLFGFVDRPNDRRTFNEVERGLYKLMFTLARLFIAFFLTRREENSQREVQRWTRKGFRKRKPERKYLNTIFGRVCFWRMYVRRPGANGLHPLDLALGLTADGFSLWAMELGARLSTLMPYDQVTGLLLYLFTWSPSKTTVEKAVLGFGRHTQDWFKSAPAPEGDGEILVTQIDGKAIPTATEEELEKRRGKRPANEERPLSPRHRGRAKRARRGPKRRKNPGDKSKNGKAATIVIQYTLKMARDKNGEPVLLGPINKKFYASYASKSHAFAIARREADKRGFTKESGKRHQIVTDGDEDFARLAEDLFPEAIHTLDIMHVLEYVWEAGRFLYKAGSKKLASWVKKQENLLYKGKTLLVVQHICDIRDNVGKKASERLETIRMYLQKRLHMMFYDELRKEDLEIASGVVEGGVKHVIGKRFDNGSMRWIRERAEALLQLRCIEINGDWEKFVRFVARELSKEGKAAERPARLLTTLPNQLPTFGIAA